MSFSHFRTFIVDNNNGVELLSGTDLVDHIIMKKYLLSNQLIIQIKIT